MCPFQPTSPSLSLLLRPSSLSLPPPPPPTFTDTHTHTECMQSHTKKIHMHTHSLSLSWDNHTGWQGVNTKNSLTHSLSLSLSLSAHLDYPKQLKDALATQIGSSNDVLLSTRVTGGNSLGSGHRQRLGEANEVLSCRFPGNVVCRVIGLWHVTNTSNVRSCHMKP